MKQKTKTMLVYGAVGLFIYMTVSGAYSDGRKVGTMLFPSNAASAANSDLQLYGIGNPPNWY